MRGEVERLRPWAMRKATMLPKEKSYDIAKREKATMSPKEKSYSIAKSEKLRYCQKRKATVLAKANSYNVAKRENLRCCRREALLTRARSLNDPRHKSGRQRKANNINSCRDKSGKRPGKQSRCTPKSMANVHPQTRHPWTPRKAGREDMNLMYGQSYFLVSRDPRKIVGNS